MMFSKLFFVSIIGFSSFCFANDGVLPRGRTPIGAPNPTQQVEIQDQAKEKTESNTCREYIANPSLGDFYESSKDFIYFVSRLAGEGKSSSTKTYIYEVDLKSRSARRIVGLKLDGSPVVIGHGQPVDGATVLDFPSNRLLCGEGSSPGLGVQWGRQQKIVRNFPASRYKIVPSETGSQLADLNTGSFLGFDFSSLQRRTLLSFDKLLTPLYVEFQPPRVIGYHPQKNELQEFIGGKPTPESILVLKKGTKFIQSGRLFGLIEPGKEPHKVLLRSIKGWSGDSYRTHSIDLPKDWSFDMVRLDYNFAKEVAVVQASDLKMRLGTSADSLRKILVYQKANTAPVVELSVPKNQFFISSSLSADGVLVHILVGSMEDGGAKVFKTWNLDERKWLDDIPLNREQGGDKSMNTTK